MKAVRLCFKTLFIGQCRPEFQQSFQLNGAKGTFCKDTKVFHSLGINNIGLHI